MAEIAVGLVFFTMALGAMVMTRVNSGVALIWPASAAAAAILIRLPQVRWFSAAMALLVASIAANALFQHRSWSIFAQFACFYGAEIGLMVWAFRGLVRFPYPHISIEQATIMTVVFGIAIPGLTALGCGIALHGFDGLSFTQEAAQWWAPHAMGACLFGPPIILFSPKTLRRLATGKFLIENLVALLIVLVGCWVTIRYVHFPFVTIGVLLLIAAFRVGGFGVSVFGLVCGIMIAALWSFGMRPAGLEDASAATSLAALPVIALLATTMPAIAVGLGTDARRAVARQLKSSEHRFRESMKHSPIGMLLANLDGVWSYTNLALQNMLDYSAEELLAFPPGGPSEAQEWASSAQRWQRLLTGEIEHYDVERRFRHKDGRWIWTHVAVSLLRDAEGLPLHLIAQIESLEERRRAESILAEERERLKITLSSIGDAVITTDADAHITYINVAGEKLLGQGLPSLEHRRLDEIITLTDPRTCKAAANLVGLSQVHGTAFRRETPCVLHRPDGIVCYVRDVVSPVLDSQGLITGIVVVLQDASADFEREREMVHRATHDTLTGLANRFEFQRQLTEVYARTGLTQSPAAIFAIDLDRFKEVNDAAGHAAGDAMLARVADALRGSVSLGKSDLIARVGGDEFAIIVEKCPETRSHLIGQQVLQALNPLQMEWEGALYGIGASVGVAMSGVRYDSAEAWLEAADQACYRAKKQGRGQLRRVEDDDAGLHRQAGAKPA